MKKGMKKLLSLVLSLAMVVSLLPSMAAEAAVVDASKANVWEAVPTDAGDEATSVNVAAYKNGGKADADNVTVTGGDKGFLNDGTYTNSWVAASASYPVSGWVTFDAKYSVDTVRVVFKEGQVYNFTVSYYNTNTGAYTELYKGTSYDEANAENEKIGHKYYSEIILAKPIVTNKIKVTLTSGPDATTVPAIAEIEAFGTKYDPNKEPRNLSVGATATASNVDYNRGPERALDGNFGSYWDGGLIGSGQWMMVDLGEVCKLTELQVTTYHDAGDNRYYLYYVEVSTDGETWTKVADREKTYGTVAAFRGETYTFAEPVEAQFVRATITKNSANGYTHIKELEIWGYPSVIRENIALGKVVSSSNTDLGHGADVVVDGDYSNYWDGGTAPQSFMIDLGAGYFVDLMKAYPYNDGRTYEYYIEASLDGAEFTKLFERTKDMGPATAGETFELEEPMEMRFVKVTMTYNSANPSVHMKEFEVFGELNPDYEAPSGDTKDPKNIAYGKTVRTHLASKSVQMINDGMDVTTCTGEFAPAYFDIDLEENYDLSEISLSFPASNSTYYYYTVYGSVDGSNYDRLFQQRSQEPETDGVQVINLKELGLDTTEYRIVRVYMEYALGSKSAILSEVRVHGTATGENKGALRTGTIDEVLAIKPFNQTVYAEEITVDETIENVYGIIDRNIGEAYREWFMFDISENTENDNDYFIVGSHAPTGKILIQGNNGVSLASGLNYYLEEYCNVQVAEQTSQVKMPAEIVAMEAPVRCETPYAVRYAFNYCTLNYTFSYADAEVFQREYDWLALSGVNCVLDLAGQEAVWIKFLQNFGYSFDEAKDWIAGPSYYAWQFMDNMEVVGGPVSDEWVFGRLDMARANQRFKNSLGMQTVFQGYAGMIPCNFADFQPDVEILDQGTWCDLPRPDMIRTDGDLYDQYAELFYAAQEWAFGPNSDYYAVDPFHEGGIRPDDLSDEVIAEEVLDSLLEYDEDAVWMVQAWWDNPTNELLNGMGEYRQDHVLILDLTGVYDSKWDTTSYGNTKLDNIEFNGTDWVCCLLDNYGGNPSMDGKLQRVIDEITRARDEAQYMKGIGLISEATFDNPALYQMLFDTTWVSEGTINMDEWLDNYVEDRYGMVTENAREAWTLLEETVYARGGHTSQVMASTGPSLKTYGVPYSSVKLEKALALLFKDFDLLCGSESYMYDLTEIMRQVVNNYAVVELGNLTAAYEAKDVETFKALKEKYLSAFDLLELVLGTQKDLMAGNWIGGAEDWATDTGADDFAYDSMVINAKTIITVWAPSSYLGSYAYRNYQGMFDDIYKPLWQNFLDRQTEILENGSTEIPSMGYTKTCMEWIYGDQDYEREADNSPENMKYVVSRVIEECSTETPLPEYPENEGNIALGKEVTATHERPDSPGAPGGGYAEHITDGRPETYWDGIEWAYNPEAVIDLEGVYSIDQMNVLCYVSASRYYLYDIYTSLDGEEWTQVVNKTATKPGTDAGDTFTFEDVTARYVKLVGTYNSSNEGFHVKEVRVYGEEVVVTPTPEVTPTPDPTPEVTPTPDPTPEVTPTPDPTPEVTPTPDPTPEVTPTPDPTPEVTPTPDPTPVVTPDPEPVAEELPLEAIVATTAGDYETDGGASEGPAELATDGNAGTKWHTEWFPEEGNSYETHWLQLELDGFYEVSGFKYLPRQDQSTNGDITKYQILVSVNGKDWTVAAEGDFASGKEWKEVTFDAQVAKYVRLQAVETLGDQGNKHFTAAAEVRVIGLETEYVAPVDKAELETLLEETKKLDVSPYTEESVLNLLFTMNDVQKVVNNADATQEEVDAALATLQAAIEALVEKAPVVKPVDKTALQAALDAANALDPYEYKDFTGVMDAIWEAQKVADKANATQEEVDAAKAALDAAVAALEKNTPVEPTPEPTPDPKPEVNKAPLQSLIDGVITDGSQYTEESWAVFTEAVEAAKVVLENEKATQEEVNAAYSALMMAAVQLEKKPVDPTPGPTPEVTPDPTPEVTPTPEPTKDPVYEVFPDVKETAWYVPGVQFVYDNGLMSGSNGLFNPTADITRAQLVTTLYRLAGEPAVTDKSALTDFSDVPEGKYYTDAVCWAYATGVTTGTDGKFNPTDKLTRQQMASFFFRYAEVMGMDTSARGDYSSMVNADKLSSYAKEPMAWAVGEGLISGSDVTVNGVAAKDLNPRGNTTRAQVATILMRFCAE